MIKGIFLVFGLLAFSATSYSDVGQIQPVNHTQVKNDVENRIQTNQADQKETDVVVNQVSRKRWSAGKIIGLTLGICIVITIALCCIFFVFLLPDALASIGQHPVPAF